MLWWFPYGGVVVGSQVVTGLAAALIAPLLTGVTLGLTGSQGFSQQMGRNEAFNHGGNMTAALFAGFAYVVLAIGVSVRSKKLEAKRLRY